MAGLNFRNKKQQEKYDKIGIITSEIICLYNENAVRFICEHFDQKNAHAPDETRLISVPITL